MSLKKRPPEAKPAAPPSRGNDVIAVVLGLGVYLAFVFWLHFLLIGVPVVVPGLYCSVPIDTTTQLVLLD